MIKFDQSSCRDLDSASKREWIETNGLGGFASSTVAGLNTRRYHGLLVAAADPPAGRVVLLSKLEDALVVDGSRYELSVNQYPGTIHPSGHQHLTGFRLDPFPIYTYTLNGVSLEKPVFMKYGENTVAVRYEIKGLDPRPGNCYLEVRPLIAFRDFHSTTHRNSSLNSEVHGETNLLRIRPYEGLPALYFAHNATELDATGWWYYDFEYREEQARGLDFREDLFSPFFLRFDMSGQQGASIIVSTEAWDISSITQLWHAEIERREKILRSSPSDDDMIRSLVAASDQYIVDRQKGKTIIAGYHWFGDWGRDAMISLTGLTLVTGRDEVARSILKEFARYADRGMLPNRFPDAGDAPEYNTVDAGLWFFEAVRALGDYTGDYEFIRTSLYDVMVEIIDWHVRGSRYGIKLDSDGLVAAGEPGVQLTWMDAKVGDFVVTPRCGKPVEIQALWYNALCIMVDLAARFSDTVRAKRYAEMASRTKKSFNRLFWNEEDSCLYDVVD